MGQTDILFLGRTLWPFLAAAGLLGMLCGLAAWSPRPLRLREWLLAGLAAVVVLACWAAMLSGRVPGRGGLALDMAGLLLAAFVAACLLGSGLRRLVLRPSADWS